MRIFLSLFCLFFAVSSVKADTVSDLGSEGLSARIAYLREDPTRYGFELAMMLGLQGIERLLQTQYRYGIGQELSMLGFQGLSASGSASIEDAPATIWRDAYSQLDADMRAARAALDAAPPQPFVLDLSDVWLDVNGNGRRETAESPSQILGPFLFSRQQLREMESLASVEVRFDEADADWLIAYTHIFAAVANFALAFDPTEVVEDLRAQREMMRNAPPIAYAFDESQIRAEIAALQEELVAAKSEVDRLSILKEEAKQQWDETRAALSASKDQARISEMTSADVLARKSYLDAAGEWSRARRMRTRIETEIDDLKLKLPIQNQGNAGWQDVAQGFVPTANAVHVILSALRQQPDTAHIQGVRTHLLAMIEHNRKFWAALAEETDNDREWIPNPNQDAALGMDMPADIGPAWLAVLQDAKDVLNGRLLVSHPLLPPGTGVNVAAYFDDPRDLDILDWMHGIAAYRYAAMGPMISERRWVRFSRLVNGRGGAFAVFLN